MLRILNSVSKTLGSFNTQYCAQQLPPTARNNYQKLEEVLFKYLIKSQNKEAIGYMSDELKKDYADFNPNQELTDHFQELDISHNKTN